MFRSTRALRERVIRSTTGIVTLAATGAMFGSCSATEPTAAIERPPVAETFGAVISPNEATVEFGLVDVGSGFPPAAGHDQSRHANDTMVPGTVVIDVGGSVTFNIVNPHQISIYEPGTLPEDIDTSIRSAMPAGCPNPGGNALITDPNGLVVAWANPCNAPRQPLTYQFDEPGRYLVICSFDPHFQIGMYGWVIVRDP
jgi:plastocyanin